MVKTIKEQIIERRSYLRLKTALNTTYTVTGSNRIHKAAAEDISAEGLRLVASDKSLKEGDALEMKLEIPGGNNPVHANGRVIWKRKLSLEDASPLSVGVELVEIEEDNKNTFLKFVCDLIYSLTEDKNNAKFKNKN
ncbi:MAG: PilZ domain-containing protein [Candidatus Omnitrophota bacterium]|jgi:c-di-GMP-binding flagellar brake protein YcgR